MTPHAEPMTHPRAERVRAVAVLAGRSARRRTGTFLVEGPQACREALRAHLGEGPAGAAADASETGTAGASEASGRWNMGCMVRP